MFLSWGWSEKVCQGNAAGLDDAQRTELLNYHNKLREDIAKGLANNNEGLLSSAKNMYKLKYDCKLEKAVFQEVNKCESRVTFTNGYGQNIAAIPQGLIADKGNQLKMALDMWYSPIKYYGLKNPDNKYNDARLYTFANKSDFERIKKVKNRNNEVKHFIQLEFSFTVSVKK
ncbi:SCP-like protein [Necator americanus]|uniref:SCP-like protein n=1 Tax=Necator americanus TaxID=51031 RepID=W2TDE6_NECAM|nr:SCP-like protein [Necator americanus]ETN79833.1 SCP-like protein [Necator americanus]